MGTTHQEADPDDRTRKDIGERGAEPDPPKPQDNENAKRRDDEAAELKSAGIEDSDDQNGNDVVNDRQSQQEDPHIDWDRSPEQGKHAHGKGYIRGGRDGPTHAARGVGVEAQIN